MQILISNSRSNLNRNREHLLKLLVLKIIFEHLSLNEFSNVAVLLILNNKLLDCKSNITTGSMWSYLSQHSQCLSIYVAPIAIKQIEVPH